MKVHGRAEIVNELGLHLRAAGELVREAEKYKSRIQIKASGLEANGKSVLSVMSLAAGKGSSIDITAEGPDAETAVKGISDLVARRFGEPK